MVELNEWLHESYLNNNGDIHKFKIQNEQLLERLQDTCSSSYVSYCHMVDCSEDSHEMRDHERHGKLQVLNVVEDYLDEILSLVVVEEELEFPLKNGYTLFEEVHDSTSLEQTHEESFSFLREVNNTNPMDPPNHEKSSLFYGITIKVNQNTCFRCALHFFKKFIESALKFHKLFQNSKICICYEHFPSILKLHTLL